MRSQRRIDIFQWNDREKLTFWRAEEESIGLVQSILTSLVSFRMPNVEADDLVTRGGRSSRICFWIGVLREFRYIL